MSTIIGLALFCQPLLLASEEAAETEELAAKIDAALTAATRFMIKQQEEDGSWRSKTYGVLRDDLSLTPFVLSTLYSMPRHRQDVAGSFGRGVDFLISLVNDDGRVDPGKNGLRYPTYTAAAASWVVALDKQTPKHLRAQAAWLDYLRERQLTKALGWKKSDLQYGGWGYWIGIPRKPTSPLISDGRPIEANLSATLFAIAALRAVPITTDDAVYQDILVFVGRCQNYSEDPQPADPQFDDGGFFFSPTDAARNKAGARAAGSTGFAGGIDKIERERYYSYGSMTADGLRALLRCGLPVDHPRVVAARRWLEYHFSPHTNPGTFAPDREVLRDAYYYYYCWSVAHAFMALDVREINGKHGMVNWVRALAEELIRRQRPDGSWVNHYTDAKEDDPLIATAFAAAALAICRRMCEWE